MQQVREQSPTLCAPVVYSLDEGNGAISLYEKYHYIYIYATLKSNFTLIAWDMET